MFLNIIKMYEEARPFSEKKLEILSINITAGLEFIIEVKEKREKFTNHDVIILSLYRKLIEQLDGIFGLAEIRSDSATTIVIRSLFETSLGLNYILQSSTKIEERAFTYYVGYIHEEIKVIKKSLHMKNYKVLSKDKLTERLHSNEHILNSERFKKINKEWIKKKHENSNFPPKWYSLFNGPSNLKKLAEKVGQLEIYNYIYSIFSLETHGFSALKDFKKTKDGIKILDIRSSEELSMQIFLGCTIFSAATARIVQYFLPEYNEEFARFYDYTYSNLK